jgi:hypothetical protein
MCHHWQQAVEMRTLLMWTGCLSEEQPRLQTSQRRSGWVLRWPLRALHTIQL